MATRISTRLSPKELRRFAFTVAIPLAILGAVGAWRGHTLTPAMLGGLAASLAGCGLLAPGLLTPVHRLWMGLANALGWFNTRLLLGLAYYAVITPTGVIMRLLGHDPLNRRLGDRPSYWVQRERRPDLERSMERHF